MTRTTDGVDRHVGARIRLRRVLGGLSQDKLGKAIGVTFQQVQKYEKGANRIGASRLQQVAQLLGVPVTYFFEGAPLPPGAAGFAEGEQAAFEPAMAGPAVAVMSDPEGRRVAAAFARIGDPTVRRRLADLAEALAGEPARSFEGKPFEGKPFEETNASVRHRDQD